MNPVEEYAHELNAWDLAYPGIFIQFMNVNNNPLLEAEYKTVVFSQLLMIHGITPIMRKNEYARLIELAEEIFLSELKDK